MSIQNVKITMTRINEISIYDPVRRVRYLPVAEVTHCGDRKGKTKLEIDGLVESRKYPDALVIGQTYFAVLVKGTFRVFDEDCTLQGEVSAEAVGAPVQVWGNYFICRKGDVIYAVSEKGAVSASRPLTDAEKAMLDANEN